MKIPRLIAAIAAATLLAAGTVACGQPTPADYPAPTTWTVAYQGQSYCGYQYDAHEVDMYGTLICTRVRYPSATDAVVAGTLAAAMLLYLETYSTFYHSGYWYDRFYAPLGPRYHITVIQRTTVINNFHTFDSHYAGDIKTNSAKAAWTGGKKGNYTFPTSNTKGKTGPLTNTNIATTGGRARAGRAVRPGRQRQAEEPAVTNTPPGMYQISLDDGPRLDSPEHFIEAGRALADRYPGAFTAHRAIEALAWLAQCGYLVSAAQHNRCREEHAARLSHAEQAADELVSRLDAAGER